MRSFSELMRLKSVAGMWEGNCAYIVLWLAYCSVSWACPPRFRCPPHVTALKFILQTIEWNAGMCLYLCINQYVMCSRPYSFACSRAWQVSLEAWLCSCMPEWPCSYTNTQTNTLTNVRLCPVARSCVSALLCSVCFPVPQHLRHYDTVAYALKKTISIIYSIFVLQVFARIFFK